MELSPFRPQVLTRWLLVLTVSALVSACGGGGGGGSTPPPPVNVAPSVDAGANISVVELTSVSITAIASDSDGSIASYAWSKENGPTVTLTGASSPTVGFAAPATTSTVTITLKVTVTDNDGATATDTVVVSVIPAGEVPPTLTLTGRITFDLVPVTSGGLDYANTQVTPAAGIRVHAIDASNRTTVLATANTDANGNYSMVIPSLRNMFVRARAEMIKTGTPDWDVSVVDNDGLNESWPVDQVKPVWAVFSQNFDSGATNIRVDLHAASGWTGNAYTQPRAAAPFSILYAVKQAMDLVVQADGNASFPALALNWSPNNDPSGEVYTSFYDGTEIFLLGKADVDTEEYDHGVIVHEWGHYFEDVFSRADSVGGNHMGGDVLDARVAFGEGWGNAFQGMARGTSVYIDTNGARQDSAFSFDVEENCESANRWGPRGWFNECSVQSALFDIFDPANPSESSGDNVSLGFGPIYDILVAEQKNTQSLTTIHAFAKFLRDQNGASQGGIDGLLNYHEIVSGAALDIWANNESNVASTSTDGLDAEVRNSILPLYKSGFGLGSPVNLCVDVDPTEGDYNKLGNRQFIRFTVPSTGLYQITSTNTYIEPGLTVTPDPDMILYNRGPTHYAFDAPNSVETFCGTGQSFDFGPCVNGMLSLSANVDYVLEVQDDNDLSYDLDSAHIGKYCMNIVLSQ